MNLCWQRARLSVGTKHYITVLSARCCVFDGLIRADRRLYLSSGVSWATVSGGFKSVLTSHTHTRWDWFQIWGIRLISIERGDSKKKKCCVRLDEPSVSTAEVNRSLRAEPGYSVSRLRVSVKGDARCASRWAVTQCLTELLSTPVRGKAKKHLFRWETHRRGSFVLPLTQKCHQETLK